MQISEKSTFSLLTIAVPFWIMNSTFLQVDVILSAIGLFCNILSAIGLCQTSVNVPFSGWPSWQSARPHGRRTDLIMISLRAAWRDTQKERSFFLLSGMQTWLWLHEKSDCHVCQLDKWERQKLRSLSHWLVMQTLGSILFCGRACGTWVFVHIRSE